MMHHGASIMINKLPGISRLLPSYVAQGVVEQLLLEADHRPPVLALAHTEGGELGEPSLHNLNTNVLRKHFLGINFICPFIPVKPISIKFVFKSHTHNKIECVRRVRFEF